MKEMMMMCTATGSLNIINIMMLTDIRMMMTTTMTEMMMTEKDMMLVVC